jgi:hypothetical protein
MIAGTFLALLLGCAAVAYVVMPLIRNESSAAAGNHQALSKERELQSRQQMLFAALKDLDDDRSTDKIDEADFEHLKNRLSQQAIDVMQQLDVMEGEREEADEKARKAAAPLPYPSRKRQD